MKKICFLFSFTISILIACNSTTINFIEISKIPRDVQNNIDAKSTLQLINDGKNSSYIVFHSKRSVISTIEAEGGKIKINLDEVSPQDHIIEQHVYKLMKNPEHEIIDVYINGKSTPFDVVTGL